MGLASVVHNGLQIPFSFNLRVSHPAPSPKCSCVRSVVHHHISAFCSVYHCPRAHRESVPILCSKPTVHEGNRIRTSAQSNYDISSIEIETSGTQSSTKNTQESQGPETYVSSVRNVALWVCTAVAFGVGLGFKDGVGKASEFFAGYILEQSLSVDNLFIFVLIFKYFKSRVLSYGVAGAVVFRLTLILLGTATLQHIMMETGSKQMRMGCGKGQTFWAGQPFLLTVAVIELSDIAFAVDSKPAVFGVTWDPFIVFTSNLFAILSLRSLYPIISEGMSALEYLQPSIAVVLGFIGWKMILDYFEIHVSTEASLGFVASSLSIGVLSSLVKKSDWPRK